MQGCCRIYLYCVISIAYFVQRMRWDKKCEIRFCEKGMRNVVLNLVECLPLIKGIE